MNQDLKDLIDLKNKYDEEHDKYLRALADMDNVRKNFAKKEEELETYKYEDLMKDFLYVLDDIDRMMTSDDLAANKGVSIIVSNIYNILSKYGLGQMYPENGNTFNVDTMEAVSVVDAGKENTNIVLDCPMKGYSYNGKIIRYPRVIVGK